MLFFASTRLLSGWVGFRLPVPRQGSVLLSQLEVQLLLGGVWLRLTEGSWYTSGISGVGLMIVGAVSGFLGWVLGLPVVYC